MAMNNFSFKHGCCTIVFILFVFFVKGTNIFIEAGTLKGKDAELVKRKGTVKTIKSEDGDIIDCVNIYSQPAFDHPLLNNHTIQDVRIKSYSYSNVSIEQKIHPKISQTWHNNGRCLEGTIPIRRTKNLLDGGRTYPLKKHRSSNNEVHRSSNNEVHEYAIVRSDAGIYNGAHAIFNTWNPRTNLFEFSLAQLWVVANVRGVDQETLEVGWHVYPQFYGDTQTRLFILWTVDNYQHFCYNLLCSGFVQTSSSIALGSAFSTSTYGQTQFELTIDLYKDPQTADWILKVNNDMVGYWPVSLFNHLVVFATNIDWGGEIIDSNGNMHTTTQMGSGHFSSEGYQRASYVRELRIMNENYNWIVPQSLNPFATDNQCYDVLTSGNDLFFFGGPGLSSTCP